MKKFFSEFLRRGLMACGFGPVVLAIVYMILHYTANVQTLTVGQVCVGIFSITLLAFIAGGMNAVYQIERLPLMIAILTHGVILYISYLFTYILNSWLEWGLAPILAFTGIFIVAYLVIWVIIYSVTRKSTKHINIKLKEKQQANNV
ncbi:MAG: DUF3021 domain-containing protein [Clostridia bacterium]|nr:DUF3021 domain-containing protein [Clostridia bacterium]